MNFPGAIGAVEQCEARCAGQAGNPWERLPETSTGTLDAKKHMNEEIRQPETIVVGELDFFLVEPYRVISNDPPISEGPLYRCKQRCGLYMPNAEFLLGQSEVPSMLAIRTGESWPG